MLRALLSTGIWDRAAAPYINPARAPRVPRPGCAERTDKTPVLGSRIGYVTVVSIADAIRRAGATDTSRRSAPLSSSASSPARTMTQAEGRAGGVISARVCEALVRAVGLRNVIAHGYAGVRPEMVHAASTSGLADLESFAQEVATWARGQR